MPVLTWVCANLGFIVHTPCHYCEMVATAVPRQQGLKAFGGGLESYKLRKRVQHLGMNKYIPFVFCDSKLFTSWLCLLKSWSIADFAERIQLWNQGSLSYGIWIRPFRM